MTQNATNPQDGGATRREFIKKSTLAAAATAASVNLFKTPVYGQTTAPSTGRVIGANDRIRVGYIGAGNQGANAHIKMQKEAAAANNIEQVAVCDLSKQRQEDAAAIIGPECAKFKDYEELLARKDIDAVTISTHDIWHCRSTLVALDAGKHVYVEKPMTRYLAESYEIVDKVKATGKIVQVGSQGCSAEGWQKAADMITKKNAIGTVVWAQGYYCRNSVNGEWNIPIPDWCNRPGDLDWDKWQAPVHDKIPYDSERYMHWRKYYPYCAGLLGDLVPHRLLPLMLATGNTEFPTRVTSLGTKNVHADKGDPNKIWPERDCPETVEILVEFPSGMSLVIGTSTVNGRSPGFSIYGHKGTLEISVLGEKIKLTPEKDFSEEVDLLNLEGLAPENIPAHEKNWFDCIRSGKQPNANVDLALRAQAVVSLAEMSNRMNMMCLYDAETRMIKTSDGKEIPPITYGTLEPS